MTDKTTCTVTQNGVTVTLTVGVGPGAGDVFEVLRLAFLGVGFSPDTVKEFMSDDS